MSSRLPRLARPACARFYSTNLKPNITAFKNLCSRRTTQADYPLSHSITNNIPIYDITSFSLSDTLKIHQVQRELQQLLHHGPGIYILKHMYPSSALIDRVNTTFARIIQSESESSNTKGDHFAPGGANSRIWNSFGKHCLMDPSSFASYYSNPWLRIVSESWLGPAYRLTAQTNIVRPGGKPQIAHRDYHLGFQTVEACAVFPLAAQVASQFLTLQGAVAHTDMPVESGPTRFLPFSQTYAEGFVAYREVEFQEYFEENWVALPLEKGDGVFFNPALFHAAGENTSKSVQRSANLLQVSSAFGRTMEMVDTRVLIERSWEYLASMYQRDGLSDQVECLVRAIAEGYPFPTNLDKCPPGPGGMAPEDEQSLLRKMLKVHADTDTVLLAITEMRENSQM